MIEQAVLDEVLKELELLVKRQLSNWTRKLYFGINKIN